MKKRTLNELRRKKQFLLLRNSLKRASGIMILLAVSLALMYAGWRILVKNPHFFVKKIVTSIAFDELNTLQKKLRGTSLFRISLSSYASAIRKAHPEFKYVRLEKVFPHTLKITIIDRKPMAQLVVNKRYVVVDDEGIILNDGSLERDPALIEIIDRVITVPAAKKGSKIQVEEVQAALSLLKEIHNKKILNKYPLICTVSIGSLSTIYFDIGGVLIHVGEPPYAEKIAVLGDSLLPQFKGSLHDLKQIDLRFNPPVIGYKR